MKETAEREGGTSGSKSQLLDGQRHNVRVHENVEKMSGPVEWCETERSVASPASPVRKSCQYVTSPASPLQPPREEEPSLEKSVPLEMGIPTYIDLLAWPEITPHGN